MSETKKSGNSFLAGGDAPDASTPPSQTPEPYRSDRDAACTEWLSKAQTATESLVIRRMDFYAGANWASTQPPQEERAEFEKWADKNRIGTGTNRTATRLAWEAARAELAAPAQEIEIWRKKAAKWDESESILFDFKEITCRNGVKHSREKYADCLYCMIDRLAAPQTNAQLELQSVLNDWNALVRAIESPTNGGAVGHAAAIMRELKKLRGLAASSPQARTPEYISELYKHVRYVCEQYQFSAGEVPASVFLTKERFPEIWTGELAGASPSSPAAKEHDADNS